MKTALTKKQRKTLDFVISFIEEKGYSPSYREIANGLKLSSVATVAQHIDTLVEKGFLEKGNNSARSLLPVDELEASIGEPGVGLPILGLIAAGSPIETISGHKETLEGGAESARRILKAGGRLGMGGDYGFAWNPHGDYAKELEFFVNYVGLKPLDVLKSATRTGAEILGRAHELGTLEPGKLADVLVVEGDPIADIGLLRNRDRFIAVVQGGLVKAGQLTRTNNPTR